MASWISNTIQIFIQEFLQAMEMLPSCSFKVPIMRTIFSMLQTSFKRWWCYCKHRRVMLHNSSAKEKFEHICFELIQYGELCKVRHFHVSFQILFKFQRINSRLLQATIELLNIYSSPNVYTDIHSELQNLLQVHKCFISNLQVLNYYRHWQFEFRFSFI